MPLACLLVICWLEIFIYFFLLGLHCCSWAFSSSGEQELLFIAVCGLLIPGTSDTEHRLQGTRASVVAAPRL